MLRLQKLAHVFAALIFAYGDVFHFRRDDALARVMHLADVHAFFGTARQAQ